MTNNKKRKLIILSSALALLALAVAIFFIYRSVEASRTQEREAQERETRVMELRQQRYAHFMNFETHTGRHSAFLAWLEYKDNPEAQRFTSIEFVRSEEEAMRRYQHEPDTLFAWPGVAAETTLAYMSEIIRHYKTGEGSANPPLLLPDDPELVIPASLTTPFSMEYLLELWEDVNELYLSLHSTDQTRITEFFDIRLISQERRTPPEESSPDYELYMEILESGRQVRAERRIRREQYLEWWAQERGELASDLIKPRYAHFMAFETQTGGDSAFYTWTASEDDSEAQQFTNIVFVHSENEVGNYDSNTLVAWPGWGTEQVLYELNRYLREIDRATIVFPSSLSLPLIVGDLIEHWEDIDDMFFSLHNDIRINITRSAWRLGFTREYSFTREMRFIQYGRWERHIVEREAWEQERLERREQYERWWTRERRRGN